MPALIMTRMATPSIKEWHTRMRPRETKAARRWWYSTARSRDLKPWWFDAGSTPPSGESRSRGGNPFSVLATAQSDGSDGICTRMSEYKRKCKKIVKLLKVDQSLKPVRPVPSRICCGSLRSNLRSMYPPELTHAQELSIKTAAKAESQPCDSCKVLLDDQMEAWKKARLAPAEVNDADLERFSVAFSRNVPLAWNDMKCPYVPNGHACLDYSRRDGGNWNEGRFSERCSIQAVHSAGKPRVVTVYSEYNNRVLTPLHHSLYQALQRRKWLLVGKPTHERLRRLDSENRGNQWLSFDYEAATDNIKIAYVRRAIEILIDKGEGLSETEIRCLRSVGRLKIDGVDAETGQPMGSLMSFPLLCLVNKTVVDLGLLDLFESGKIGFKEWSRHRCLINGDDLLTKSTSCGDLSAAIGYRGAQVGLRVNASKTMVSTEYGEINSTVFRNCVEQKKTNVSALWMAADVEDVLGFADEAACRPAGFRALVHAAASRLARQKIKTSSPLRWDRREALLASPTIKKALRCQPTSEVAKPTNLFPVVPVPDGYSLSRGEEIDAIDREVVRIRSFGLWEPLHGQRRALRAQRKLVRAEEVKGGPSFQRILRRKQPLAEESVLSILADQWHEKIKESLRVARPDVFFDHPSDQSPVGFITDLIKQHKERRVEIVPSAPSGGFGWKQSDYVSLI